MDMTTFSFLIPIFPEMMLQKGISLSIIGAIMSFYPIAYFAISIYFGKKLHKYKKYNIVVFSQIFLVLSNSIFIFIDLFQNKFVNFLKLTLKLKKFFEFFSGPKKYFSYILSFFYKV